MTGTRSIFTPQQQFSLPKYSDDNCTSTGFRPVLRWRHPPLTAKILTIAITLCCCSCCHGTRSVTNEWRKAFVTSSSESQSQGPRSHTVNNSTIRFFFLLTINPIDILSTEFSLMLTLKTFFNKLIKSFYVSPCNIYIYTILLNFTDYSFKSLPYHFTELTS